MKTRCNQQTFLFQAQNKRNLFAHFNGGNICSDAGGLLLQQTEGITGLVLVQLLRYLKDDCAAVRTIERIGTLNIGFGAVLFALQAPLDRFGNAQGVIIGHQSRQAVHANGNIAYELIAGFQGEGITYFICRAVAVNFFYGND